jgi:putative ABC transport system substrate-binding protein
MGVTINSLLTTGMHTMRKQFYPLPVVVAALLVGVVVSGADDGARQQIEPRQEVGFIAQLFHLKKMKPDVKRVGLICRKGIPGHRETLRDAKQAAASIDAKLFVGYVETKSAVPKAFRTLNRKHDVQALWVVESTGVVNASVPRKYLIEKAVEEGIPLLAPTRDWVDAGAPVTLEKNSEKTEIVVNKPAASATGLQVPAKYKSRTTPIAAAN